MEATTPAQWLPHAGALWGQWPRFAEAWDYKLELRKAGVPTIYGHKIVRAIGEREVAAAVIARVDSDWQGDRWNRADIRGGRHRDRIRFPAQHRARSELRL